ncbi:MAG TPA: LuxR C-terminal-related transcriptional regulator [Candidatus Dormibacteraeota bacterium]|nr:LuxR C-terminal-related transcriptional regulator [Candidatus Dormibacteraeota bacterium]
MERPAVRLAHGLPAYASGFIGRRREIAELTALVGRARLVTLTGPAGSGKTRLAIEVASQKDGGPVVELAPLAEAALLPEAFAAAIGITPAVTRPVIDTLLDRLVDFDGLIVVDNCEHLVEACAALVDRLLRNCPGLRILATSREPLRLDGEVVWQVSALSLPRLGARLAEAQRSEAMQLFVARAQGASRRFALTAANLESVMSICVRLDGLPLAIELAAARAGAVDASDIEKQLDDRFRFLTRGFRTAPERQRTLRGAIDWSYQLLSTAEQQLLSRLAIFADGFDLDGAAMVCSGGAVLADQVGEVLARLIDKSLAVAGDRKRFRLLESLRAYGLDRLRDAGEVDTYRRRHTAYLVSLEGDHDSLDFLVRLPDEVNNVRDELAWSRALDPALHLRLATIYGRFCMRAGFIEEGRSWLAAALELPTTDSLSRAGAVEALGFLAWRQDDFEAAFRALSEAVDIARQSRDDRMLARLLGSLAFTSLGAHAVAAPIRAAMDEHISVATRLQDQAEQAMALTIRSIADASEGDLQLAWESASRALALAETDGRKASPTLYNTLGWINLMLRDPEAAGPFVARGLEMRLGKGDFIDMAGSLDASAEIAYELGARDRAMRLNGAADAIRKKAGSRPPSMSAASRERWLARAKTAMGVAADRAWADGNRMTPEEAGRYALSPIDAPPPAGPSSPASSLSVRELEIAQLVAEGLSNDEIAARLRLSRRTVEAHLDHIRTKLGARSRVDVATWVASRSTPQPASRS